MRKIRAFLFCVFVATLIPAGTESIAMAIADGGSSKLVLNFIFAYILGIVATVTIGTPIHLLFRHFNIVLPALYATLSAICVFVFGFMFIDIRVIGEWHADGSDLYAPDYSVIIPLTLASAISAWLMGRVLSANKTKDVKIGTVAPK